MIGTLGIHHLAILVNDLSKAERFYVGVLGLPVRTRHLEADGSLRSIWVELGDGAFLAIEKARPDAARRPIDGPGWHMAVLRIRREDREAWRTKLAEHGHSVTRETGFTMYCEDSDGHLVGLSHYPEPSDPVG